MNAREGGIRRSARAVLALLAICAPFAVGIPASGFDLFSALALPEFPLPLGDPAWKNLDSRLTLSHTREELYRRWKDGVETEHFTGRHSRIGLRAQLLERFAVQAWQLGSGDQTWSNFDPTKPNTFSFRDQESESGLGCTWATKDLAVSLETWTGADAFTGTFRLHPDIVAALGSNPGLAFDNTFVGRRQRLFWRKGRVTGRMQWEQGASDHVVTTQGARMDLFVPFTRQNSGYAGECAFDLRRGIEPFIRVERRGESGGGVSTRDGRFIFGHTNGDLNLSTVAAGVAFPRRHRPFFLEIDRFSLEGNLYFQNNLIVLDPLFLFTTNEMRSRQTVPAIRPWGFRLGGEIPAWRGCRTRIQYGVVDLDVRTLIGDESVEAWRLGTVRKDRERRDRFRLHRLDLAVRRPDRAGGWGLDLRLLLPQVLTAPETAAGIGGAGGGGGPSGAGGGPSPKTSARGGWQMTIERELTL